MLDNEERRVKARHDVTQFYQRRTYKRIMSQQDLLRGDMTISDVPIPNSPSDSSDDDVENDTYIPSPQAHPHEKGNGLASASGSRAAREEIEEEAEGYSGDGGDEEEEIHAHLILQSLRSPIASKGEERPKIESFEERVACFDTENPMQQWYGDMSFGGFSYGFDSGAGMSHTQPAPFASPPHNDEENEESGERSEDDE
jgi:hypothetical protein